MEFECKWSAFEDINFQAAFETNCINIDYLACNSTWVLTLKTQKPKLQFLQSLVIAKEMLYMRGNRVYVSVLCFFLHV